MQNPGAELWFQLENFTFCSETFQRSGRRYCSRWFCKPSAPRFSWYLRQAQYPPSQWTPSTALSVPLVPVVNTLIPTLLKENHVRHPFSSLHSFRSSFFLTKNGHKRASTPQLWNPNNYSMGMSKWQCRWCFRGALLWWRCKFRNSWWKGGKEKGWWWAGKEEWQLYGWE
jgi:hypothetical protein